MSENKITFPVKLASNNPKSFGIADATEISGHKSVDTLSDLYSISDPVLSVLKDGSDAVGQEWFVLSEDCKYRLDNWENRKSVAGWTKLPKQELINTKQSVSEKDQPSGYAGLDSNGKIPIEKTYGATATVADVATYESLPATGSDGVIYNVLSTGTQYKWSGSAYIDITNGADNAKKNETSIFDCSNGTSTKYYSSLLDAINVVPLVYRTSNRIISYLSTENATTTAVNYQYHGIDSTTWADLTKWEHIPNQADLAEIRSDLNNLDSEANTYRAEVLNIKSLPAGLQTYFNITLFANKNYKIINTSSNPSIFLGLYNSSDILVGSMITVDPGSEITFKPVESISKLSLQPFQISANDTIKIENLETSHIKVEQRLTSLKDSCDSFALDLSALEQEQIQGGVYDVSSHNDGAVFESLSSLLGSANLSTLIPTSVRHGGMSIRFIQSPDNRYVQYRLMTTSFSTTESNWQGIDKKPIPNSDNLVKSGGISDAIQYVRSLCSKDVLKVTNIPTGTGNQIYLNINLIPDVIYEIKNVETNHPIFIHFYDSSGSEIDINSSSIENNVIDSNSTYTFKVESQTTTVSLLSFEDATTEGYVSISNTELDNKDLLDAIKNTKIYCDILNAIKISINNGKNLLDINNVKDGVYISQSGIVETDLEYFVSEYIKVENNTQYCYSRITTGGVNSGSAGVYIAFYDEYLNLCDIPTTNDLYFTTPNTCLYIRVSGLIENKDILQLEKGNSRTEYIAFNPIDGYVQPYLIELINKIDTVETDLNSNISTIKNTMVLYAEDISTENFRIVDNKGRKIIEIGNHIETKDFNSKQVKNSVTELQENSCKPISTLLEGFGISDVNGNIIAKFKNFFDGDFVLQNISDILTSLDTINNPIKYRTKFPPINYKKEEFRWLDIGNSASFCAFYYLKRIAISQGVDLTNTSFTMLSRGAASFKSMYEGYHDLDISGLGDELTGGTYQINKTFGGAPIKVTGNSYTEPKGTPTQIIDKNVTEIPISFWGGDGSLFRSLLADNKFDVISIQATSLKVPYYDSTNGWTDNSDNGYFLEFIRLLKTLQPQATIVCYYSYINWSVAKNLNGLNTLEISYYNKIKDFLSKSGIDILIPCEMALSNLRNSSVPNTPNEGTGVLENIDSRNGFNYDSAHIAWGVAAYTMSCAAWETILAPRFDKSCYGNTYRELIEDDTIYTPSDSNTTFKYMQGSYTNSYGNKVMIDNGAYNSPIYIGCTSTNGGITWDYSNALSTIRVSDSNAKTCQMAAILAVNDMFNMTNPDNKDI